MHTRIADKCNCIVMKLIDNFRTGLHYPKVTKEYLILSCEQDPGCERRMVKGIKLPRTMYASLSFHDLDSHVLM